MTKTTYKEGDTVPLQATLPIDSDEDLSTANSVSFHLTDKFGSSVIDNSAVVVDGPNGVVQYQWGASETDRHGLFYIEWEVEWGDGSVDTFPKGDPDQIYFSKEVA